MESEKVYQVKNVQKIYQMGKKKEIEVQALAGVSFDVLSNDILALVGPSGSGKSTLLHLLGTVDKPTQGDVRFLGNDMSLLGDRELSTIRASHIGFIFQNFNLIPILSVYENIEYPLRIRNVQRTKELKERIHNLIKEIGLEEHVKHKPGELSGGQRQRVAIARALIISPSVILADEPTANLDSKTGEQILSLIRRLGDKNNTTVVFATHDQKVMDFSERKLFLRDGLIER